MANRISNLLVEFPGFKLGGEIEMDESYISELELNKHQNKKAKTSFSNKSILIGIKSCQENKVKVIVKITINLIYYNKFSIVYTKNY